MTGLLFLFIFTLCVICCCLFVDVDLGDTPDVVVVVAEESGGGNSSFPASPSFLSLESHSR